MGESNGAPTETISVVVEDLMLFTFAKAGFLWNNRRDICKTNRQQLDR